MGVTSNYVIMRMAALERQRRQEAAKSTQQSRFTPTNPSQQGSGSKTSKKASRRSSRFTEKDPLREEEERLEVERENAERDVRAALLAEIKKSPEEFDLTKAQAMLDQVTVDGHHRSRLFGNRLIEAAIKSRNTDMVEALIEKKVDVSAYGGWAKTAARCCTDPHIKAIFEQEQERQRVEGQQKKAVQVTGGKINSGGSQTVEQKSPHAKAPASTGLKL